MSGGTAERRAGSPRSRIAGFSLVELMVALVIGGTLIVAIVQTLLRMEGSWDRSQERSTTNQNTRGAIYLMVRDLRMAGTGYGGRMIVTGGVSGNRIFPVDPAPAVGSDTLKVTAGLEGVQSAVIQTVGSASDLIFVADAGDFSAGDLITLSNGVDVNMFEVTAVDAGSGQLSHSVDSPYNDPNDHVVWPNGGYPAGSRVTQVQRIAYWLDDDSPQGRLLRRVNDGAPIPVASGVDRLEVLYRMADGSLTSSPGNPVEIHAVVLRYVPRRDGGAQATDTLTVTVQPRVMS